MFFQLSNHPYRTNSYYLPVEEKQKHCTKLREDRHHRRVFLEHCHRYENKPSGPAGVFRKTPFNRELRRACINIFSKERLCLQRTLVLRFLVCELDFLLLGFKILRQERKGQNPRLTPSCFTRAVP